MIKTSLSLIDNTWALAEILDDVLKRDYSGKSVVVYPRLSIDPFNINDPIPPYFEAIRYLIKDLFEAGVIFVTCAGNDGSQNIMNKVPACWASDQFPIITAGAVDVHGDFAGFSQGNRSEGQNDTVWAPGYNIECAKGTGSFYRRQGASNQMSGTSFAAGMVRTLTAELCGDLLTGPSR